MTNAAYAPSVQYPTAKVRVTLLLEDFGAALDDGTALDDKLLQPIEVEPLRVRWLKSAPHEPNTFEVTFTSEVFPTNPEVYRGATIEVFAADAGQLSPDFWDRNLNRENLVFIGVADNIEFKMNRMDGSVFVFSGRGYEALFTDIQLEGEQLRYREATGLPAFSLKEMLEDFVRPPGESDLAKRRRNKLAGLVIRQDAEDVFPANFTSNPKQVSEKVPKAQSAWEGMIQLAERSGRILEMDLDELVIRAPKRYYEDRDGVTEDGRHFRLVLGGPEISEFEFRKRLGRIERICVRATSYGYPPGSSVPVSLATIYPKDCDKKDIPAGGDAVERGPDGKPVTNSISHHVVRDVNQSQLEAAAEQIHARMAAQQVELGIQVDSTKDFDGHPLFSMKHGDRVDVGILERSGFPSLDVATEMAKLTGVGHGDSDARRLAEAQLKVREPFHVHEVSHDIELATPDGESPEVGGYSVRIDLRRRRGLVLGEGAAA